MVHKFKQRIGTRVQVMHGIAKMTGGGLTKSKLKYNKRGKIVSRKASKLAKKNNRLVRAGYITRKGVFGVVKRGGMFNSLNGSNYNYLKSEPNTIITNNNNSALPALPAELETKATRQLVQPEEPPLQEETESLSYNSILLAIKDIIPGIIQSELLLKKFDKINAKNMRHVWNFIYSFFNNVFLENIFINDINSTKHKYDLRSLIASLFAKTDIGLQLLTHLLFKSNMGFHHKLNKRTSLTKNFKKFKSSISTEQHLLHLNGHAFNSLAKNGYKDAFKFGFYMFKYKPPSGRQLISFNPDHNGIEILIHENMNLLKYIDKDKLEETFTSMEQHFNKTSLFRLGITINDIKILLIFLVNPLSNYGIGSNHNIIIQNLIQTIGELNNKLPTNIEQDGKKYTRSLNVSCNYTTHDICGNEKKIKRKEELGKGTTGHICKVTNNKNKELFLIIKVIYTHGNKINELIGILKDSKLILKMKDIQLQSFEGKKQPYQELIMPKVNMLKRAIIGLSLPYTSEYPSFFELMVQNFKLSYNFWKTISIYKYYYFDNISVCLDSLYLFMLKQIEFIINHKYSNFNCILIDLDSVLSQLQDNPSNFNKYRNYNINTLLYNPKQNIKTMHSPSNGINTALNQSMSNLFKIENYNLEISKHFTNITTPLSFRKNKPMNNKIIEIIKYKYVLYLKLLFNLYTIFINYKHTSQDYANISNIIIYRVCLQFITQIDAQINEILKCSILYALQNGYNIFVYFFVYLDLKIENIGFKKFGDNTFYKNNDDLLKAIFEDIKEINRHILHINTAPELNVDEYICSLSDILKTTSTASVPTVSQPPQPL